MNTDEILGALNANGISLAGRIVEMPNVAQGVFIPILMHRISDGTMKPAKSALMAAKQQIEGLNYLPEFIFVNERSEEAEHSLRSSLLVSFPDLVRNVFLSVEASASNIWVELKKAASEEERQRLNDHVDRSIDLFKLPSASVLSLADIALPTRMELLSLIRTLAPVDCETLNGALQQRGFTIPSMDWINRQFDLLRKTGFVVRRHDRLYTLTLNALKRLGTGKSRRSPDVVRLLALAKGAV